MTFDFHLFFTIVKKCVFTVNESYSICIPGCNNLKTFCAYNVLKDIYKRAHRALGRSPEEKVKGHSGAIYRGPRM